MSFLLVDLLHDYPVVIERKGLFKYTQKKNEQRCYYSVNDNKQDNCFSVNIVHKTVEHHKNEQYAPKILP